MGSSIDKENGGEEIVKTGEKRLLFYLSFSLFSAGGLAFWLTWLCRNNQMSKPWGGENSAG